MEMDLSDRFQMIVTGGTVSGQIRFMLEMYDLLFTQSIRLCSLNWIFRYYGGKEVEQEKRIINNDL